MAYQMQVKKKIKNMIACILTETKNGGQNIHIIAAVLKKHLQKGLPNSLHDVSEELYSNDTFKILHYQQLLNSVTMLLLFYNCLVLGCNLSKSEISSF